MQSEVRQYERNRFSLYRSMDEMRDDGSEITICDKWYPPSYVLLLVVVDIQTRQLSPFFAISLDMRPVP